MKRFLQYVSLLMLAVAAAGCASGKKSVETNRPAVVLGDSVSQRFNLQIDFMKHHFSGMLIARRMGDEEIRLLFTSYFGLSIFDFSLRGDSLHVNSCIEPMRKKKILRLLEADFTRIFLTGRKLRIREKNAIFERRIQIKHPWIRLKIQLDELQ